MMSRRHEIVLWGQLNMASCGAAVVQASDLRVADASESSAVPGLTVKTGPF
jgi:hypothetical protein